jgi:hypothetical protein
MAERQTCSRLPIEGLESAMPDQPPESELDMVTRHVRQGEANVTHQREHIAWRRARRMDTALSEQVLGTFEASLDLHRAHLARLRSQAL